MVTHLGDQLTEPTSPADPSNLL